jgi:hypothetical protein
LRLDPALELLVQAFDLALSQIFAVAEKGLGR